MFHADQKARITSVAQGRNEVGGAEEMIRQVTQEVKYAEMRVGANDSSNAKHNSDTKCFYFSTIRYAFCIFMLKKTP